MAHKQAAKPRQESRVAGFDWRRIASVGHFIEPCQLAELLRPCFKKWAFQVEETTNQEAGNVNAHCQGRGSLFKKIRAKSQERADIAMGTGAHYFEPTTDTESAKNSFNYQLKAATRVNAPWSDQNLPKEKNSDVPLLEKHNLRPWAQTMEAKTLARLIAGPYTASATTKAPPARQHTSNTWTTKAT